MPPWLAVASSAFDSHNSRVASSVTRTKSYTSRAVLTPTPYFVSLLRANFADVLDGEGFEASRWGLRVWLIRT